MSTVIVALPNEQYKTPFDHPHVTLGFFGDPDDGTIPTMEKMVERLAHVSKPIRAFTDARSVFGSDPEYIVLVDLITAYALTELRSKIERLFGPSSAYRGTGVQLDTTLGFLPHMTRGKVADLPNGLTTADFFPERQDFTLNRLALWHGEHRYEVAL